MKKEVASLQLLWVGLVVLATGIALSFLGADYNFWSILGMLTGLLLILLYVVLNFSTVLEFLLTYSTRQWATMALFIFLLTALLIVVQMIVNNHNYRFDFTSQGDLSVTPLTKKILKEVETPVHVVGFYQEDERGQMEKVLEMYQLASDQFSYELHNLDRSPGLAKKYGINAYGNAVVETNGKSKKLAYPSEESLINAILSLTSAEQKVVYFVTGQGEHELKGTEPDCPCYGLVKESLEAENFVVKSLLFAGGKAVPADADVLVIGGPKVDFSAAELEKLDEYVLGGGGLIIAVDPGNFDRLAGLLEKYGVVLGDDVVVDTEEYLIEKSPLVPLVPFYLSHPITEGFTIPMVVSVARSVEKSTAAPEGVTVKALARSSEKSWAETDTVGAVSGSFKYTPGVDNRGPVTVAVVSEVGEEGKKKGKMVVFGDSDFLLNWYFVLAGNKDFFLNTLHWMTEDESLISTRRKEPSAEDMLPVYLEPMHARLIFMGIVILQPLAVLAAGGVIAWRRRRKG